jgi:hypothetical protein
MIENIYNLNNLKKNLQKRKTKIEKNNQKKHKKTHISTQPTLLKCVMPSHGCTGPRAPWLQRERQHTHALAMRDAES